MADENLNQDASASTSEGTSSESTVHVNVKTLDSQIYTFQVEKDMPVSSFKEKIADTIGVPVGQQRLIFRGKVLKDEHRLSEYYVEDGHTLHLVARQPAQPQTSAGANSAEANGNNDNQGNEANAGAGTGAPRNRLGQVSHSVVLGTFNIGEQGEGIVPDLTRIIGAVLNSVGVGSQIPPGGATNISSSVPSNASNQAPQGVETEAARGNIGGRGGQPFPSHPFQSFPQSLQFPFTGAAVTLPSHQMPIPDSLSTLSEFINRMELALSVNGSQSSSSPVNVGDPPRVSLPSNARGLPNLEALSIVMRQAQQLLSAHAVAALSHIAGRLEGELDATDPAVRNQIQTEAVQVGQAMQHLGALFLELGRTILTLRMGQSPVESLVNAGPAVYISPSGPNPIMVQPFPLQTSSLFGGPASAAGGGGGSGAPPNPSVMVPVGLGDSPRNVNIHIHAGTSLAGVGPRASTGDVNRGDRRNGTNSGDSGPPRVLPVRNIIATAVPSRFTADGGHSRNVFHPSHIRTQQNNLGVTSTAQGSGVATSGISQFAVGTSVPQPPPDSASIPTLVTQINAQIRNLVDDMQGENRAPSGQSAGSTIGSGTGEDSGNHQQVSLPAHGTDETSGLVPNCVPKGEGQQQQPQSHQYKNDEETSGSFSVKEASSADTAGGSSHPNEETIKSEVALENAPTSDGGPDHTVGAKAVPFGLGLGGLQPRMRRDRQGRSQGKNGGGTSSSPPINLNQQSITHGQQVLQSLVSRGSNTTRRESNDSPSGELAPLLSQTMDTNHSMPMPARPSNGQFDAAGMMSQVLNSPALNGLLAGVSEQTGIGSPDGLRNMFEQFTRSPSMRNTLNQITEQLDVQDIGNMFSGMGGGQGGGGGGGGMDFSRMIQQMMPIVTQSLSRGSAANPESSRVLEPRPQQHTNESRTARDEPEDQALQIDLQEVADRIERHDPPADIFRPVVENAAHLYGGTSSEELIEELCCDEDLANEFAEMLRRDIRRKLQGGSGSDVDSLL